MLYRKIVRRSPRKGRRLVHDDTVFFLFRPFVMTVNSFQIKN